MDKVHRSHLDKPDEPAIARAGDHKEDGGRIIVDCLDPSSDLFRRVRATEAEQRRLQFQVVAQFLKSVSVFGARLA
jgi:hypothetical protein